jgi:cytochrome d ubiquinol oxidase subunit I
MDPGQLSRLQFALTASFHFIFPPISMGLGLLLVVFGLIYVRTRDPKWRQISFFWVKVYGLVFALGVATGIVQEFEFGTNWAEYSRFVGNIFGSLLAAEGIFAFFLEGGFLGLMLFGGNRLGPRMWLLASFLVVFGAHFSALWIVMANAWMQTPAGYELLQTPTGTLAIMTSFWEVMFTPSFLPRILHVWVASWLVGASLVLSVSAWYLLKKRHVTIAQSCMKVALPLFFVLGVAQLLLFGADQAVNVTNFQPVKLAALEGLWESTACAPLYIAGWVDEAAQTTTGFSIPCLLSFLAYNDINATVTGLTAFPQDTWAPLNLTFQVYHIMINLGVLFPLIGFLGAAFYFWKRRLWSTRWVLWIFVVSIFLTELATLSGWWSAEFGRQPWIVWNVLRTADAVSPVLQGYQVLFSVLMFVVLYALLFVLFIYLLNEKIQHGPESLDDEVPVAALPDTFKDIFRRRARA